LEKDTSRSELGGISGNGERCGEVREVEDGFGKESGAEGVHGLLASRGPGPSTVFLGEVNEGAGDVGVVGDEATVEIGKAKEGADILDFLGSGPLGDAIEFDGVHGELTGFDDHTKVFNLGGGEFTFFEFKMEVEFHHTLQDTLSTFLVGGGVGGEDEEIIHVDNEPTFGDHIAEGVIHESLERGGGVGETEEHDGGFEEPLMGDEGGFPLVSVLDADIVVSPSYVELGEDLGVSKFIDEVGDEGKGIGITNGMFVEVAVVLAGAESAILLFDEEEGCGLGGIRGADLSGFEVFF